MEGLELLLETLGDGRFVDAVLTDRAGDRRVRIRPVDLARGRMVQFETTVDGATSVANVEPVEMPDRVALLLDDGYRSVFVRLTDRSEQFTVTKRGRLLRTVHAGANTSSDTSHDRQPDRSVPEDAPFLVALGLTDRNGRIKPSSRDKYLQVVRFVDILDTTLDRFSNGDTVEVVDLGCGSGVLTMAAHHHLASRGLRPRTVGVDLKSDLLGRLNATVDSLASTETGWGDLRFVSGSIADWVPETSPEIVIALHACDTATDDALAGAIAWGSKVVLAAPCCQHDLQAQLDRRDPPLGFASLVQHGIVRERLGDLLTDTARADVLAARGYRTDVIEFVAGEHTAKNLMIRAVATGRPDADAAARLDDLMTRWGVRPAIIDRLDRIGA
ncbi:MAG: class I SAM-dependent methyltransferase [Ilumatobacteraceae bacterium]